MPNVLIKFRDKLTDTIYDVGDEFNGGRQEYLASLGYIEITETTVTTEITEEKKPAKRKKKGDEQAVE